MSVSFYLSLCVCEREREIKKERKKEGQKEGMKERKQERKKEKMKERKKNHYNKRHASHAKESMFKTFVNKDVSQSTLRSFN